MQPDWDMFHVRTSYCCCSSVFTRWLCSMLTRKCSWFQSLHPMADYHGAARAVGGCAIYVRYDLLRSINLQTALDFKWWILILWFQRTLYSDKPGQHDFNLLKKLVLPDGSIMRAKLPGRPTKDCLFTDPARDGKRFIFRSSFDRSM